ncbi:MAG TPA: SDR family oxidoreductase, partial [bacterium]|nr:SDR family oxidoreductase [bacterium]
MKNKRSIFLTGVTGTLGKEIVRMLLTTTEHKLFLLIRRKSRFSHWDRARKILSEHHLEPYLGTRVQVMQGDVTLPDLGLNADDFAILRREVQDFYHIAALTALNGSREECYAVNLGGTVEALELAKKLGKTGRLERFFYFSTAFVAGSLQTYCAKEDELPGEPAHANYYEESKYHAESKVRETMKEGLPAAIFRPSIVVGHSETGEVSEFNVIYPFMRLFA